MVDEKKTEESKPEGDKKDTLIDVNVALVLAENDMLKKTVEAKDTLIQNLTKQLQQATDLIEKDTKSRLIADIKPKTAMPGEYLSKMSVDKLTEMKKYPDTAVPPVFKSSAPLVVDKKDPKAKLDSKFDEFAKATWRKN